MKDIARKVRVRMLVSTGLTVLAFLGMLAFPPVAMLGDWGGVSHGYAPFWVLAMPQPFSTWTLLQIELSRFLGQVLILMLVHWTYIAYTIAMAYIELQEVATLEGKS